MGTPTPQNTDTQLEKVIYTASLASEPAAIEPLMDPVRAITSRISGPQDLTAQDKQIIAAVQSRLEQYLFTQEKLRTFTPDSLHLQIEQHLQGASTASRSRWRLTSILLITLLAVMVAISLPGAPKEPFLLVRLAGFTAVAMLHLGAAWLFLSALPSFKSGLRKAFVVVCTGIILLGLALLEQPVIDLLGLRDTTAVGLLISVSLVTAAFTIYWGIYRYGRLVGVESRHWPIVIAAAAIALLSFLAPHAAVNGPELVHDLAATFQGWVAIFPVASFPILSHMAQKLAEVYKPPTRALQQTMIVIMMVTVWVYGIRLIVGANFAGIPAVIALTLLILEGSFLVRAGYTFNKISRY